MIIIDLIVGLIGLFLLIIPISMGIVLFSAIMTVCSVISNKYQEVMSCKKTP